MLLRCNYTQFLESRLHAVWRLLCFATVVSGSCLWSWVYFNCRRLFSDNQSVRLLVTRTILGRGEDRDRRMLSLLAWRIVMLYMILTSPWKKWKSQGRSKGETRWVVSRWFFRRLDLLNLFLASSRIVWASYWKLTVFSTCPPFPLSLLL